MKIQTLIAAVALAVAGGAFAADTASTKSSTDTNASPTSSSTSVGSAVKADAKAAKHKIKKTAHKAKNKTVHAAHHARASMHRAGDRMAHDGHMNSPHHMGAASGRSGTTDVDANASDRKARMDSAYENWKKKNG